MLLRNDRVTSDAAHHATRPVAVPPSEDADVAAARHGDREAFARLYDTHVERIFRFVRYRTSGTGEAEDVTSEVFVRALSAMPRYDPRGPFGAWLFQIARNVVIDRARSRKVRTEIAMDEAVAHPDAGHVVDPDEALVADERLRRLRDALSRLTAEQQDVVILRVVEGLSAEETGLVMGKRPDTVRAMQRRALHALRRHVSAEDLL